MTLEAGTRLGPYEILEPIGAGGMGEVYKAQDTRLGRTVAIKVLPEALAADTERRQRLEREAKAISQLSHPHICTLFDIGHEAGVDFLVMEFIDGESLATRLTTGALPIDEVLRYAVQMAEALAAAHRQGIVHRDLKPGNVMLTKEGVKLLDFGLAKVVEPTSAEAAMTQMPTLTTPLTQEGSIVGTYQYMAPEQLEGQPADARTDIFAFGCVLYEMATGRRAFTGSTQASLIGSILKEEPQPISAIQPLTPPALDRVVQTCLRKDPDKRWQSAADMANELRWVAEGGSRAGVPAAVASRRRTRERILAGAVAVLALGLIGLAYAWWPQAPTPAPVVRFELAPPAELSTVGAPRVSPDGRYIAFSGTGDDGIPRIWLRAMDDLQAHPMAGTDGAQFRPFWSPDSRYIGFIAGGKLKKVPVSGGPPQVVTDAPTGADGSWSSKGMILFDGQAADGIRRVSASGGVATEAISPKTGDDAYDVGWPEFLPDGDHFLYYQFAASGKSRKLMLANLDGKQAPSPLLDVESLVQYVSPGFLVYVREDSLLAQPFDMETLKPSGEPVPLAENLGSTNVGLADFSASAEGTLVFRSGENEGRRLVWVDRTGKEIGDEGDEALYGSPAISPDGTHVAFRIQDPQTGNFDVWVRDLKRAVTTRLTFDPGNDNDPAWSPDGKKIAFDSTRGDSHGIYVKDASGAGAVEQVVKSDVGISPVAWSRDGRWLMCDQRNKDNTRDVVAVPMTGDERGKVVPFVQSRFFDVRPSFSPDGRWVAYESWESGRAEIYVQPFPGPGGKWQISGEGGSEPRWSADGKEIFYLSAASKLTAVPVATSPTFSAGTPKPLFDVHLVQAVIRNRWYPAPDGQHFLMLEPENATQSRPMTVVLNWPEMLKQR